MKEKLKIFDLKFEPNFKKSFLKNCEEIIDRGFLTNDIYVQSLENSFSKFNHSKFSLGVSSGTASLEVALRTLNVKGKKVVLPTNTFIATYIAILNSGGIPVLIDIENKYFGICPHALQKTMSAQKIAAVIQVHIGGNISPYTPQIASLCRKEGIGYIEDCSHAHGATLNGTLAGNFGDFGCFSLFTTKVLTAGEGGILVTNHKDLYEKAKSIRQFGYDFNNPLSHIHWGSNFKLSEFPALLALLDLKRLPSRLKKRRILAERYQKNLAKTKWIPISAPVEGTGSYYKQIIISPVKREIVENVFKNKKIPLTGGVYYIPLHLQPLHRKKYKKGTFKNAENFCNSHFCPPCYPELNLKNIDNICEVILSIQK